MQLTVPQRKRIYELLLSSFTEEEMELLLRLELGLRIYDIVPKGQTLPVFMLRVLEWAERTSNLSAVLEAAAKSKNENYELNQFVQGFLSSTLSGEPSEAAAKQDHQPSVTLSIDREDRFSENRNGHQLVYSTARLSDGTNAYGEGVQLQITLEDTSDLDVSIPRVDVFVEDHDPYPIVSSDYTQYQTSGSHLEVPNSMIQEPVQLTEDSQPGSSIPITKTRLFLRGGGGVESQHTLVLKIIASSDGLWKVRIRVTYKDPMLMNEQQVAQSEIVQIIKR
jgi:hypothetical protein